MAFSSSSRGLMAIAIILSPDSDDTTTSGLRQKLINLLFNIAKDGLAQRLHYVP